MLTPRYRTKTLKAQNTIAQDNALGTNRPHNHALKGPNKLAIAAIMLAIFMALAITLPAEAAVKAYASLEPLAFFVERVGGAEVEVGVLVGAGQDPHTYEPTPKQLAEISQAQLYFRAGMQFEDMLISKIRQEGLTVVDVRQGLALRRDEHHCHAHSADAMDPHVWLSLKNATVIARTIADALTHAAPEHKALYERNLATLLADINKLESEVSEIMAPCKGKSFYVYHPAFGYFAEEYGLTQVSIEVEGKEPSARQLAGIIEKAKRDGVKIIFTELQAPSRAVQTLADEIGASVVSINPLARDYISNFHDMALKIASGCTD